MRVAGALMHCQEWDRALAWLAVIDEKRMEELQRIDRARCLAMIIVARQSRGWREGELKAAIDACHNGIRLLQGMRMQSPAEISSGIWLARACVQCGLKDEANRLLDQCGRGRVPPQLKAMMDDLRKSVK